ncbi:hypothetical protein NDA18_005986 [Ustilago nuda]|nr:hypothetical protein NDA18_005986 [Ustilago nuda]
MTDRIPPYDILEPTPMAKQVVRDKYAHFESLRAQLATIFRGQIAIRGEPLFAKSITIFNDAAPLGGWMVTMPVDVQDVSALVKFCATHRLSPSIKSGGFATAGWAIQDEVVIDTSLMHDIKLVVPNSIPSRVGAGAVPDSSPLTVPSTGLATSYQPSNLCLNRSDAASRSDSVLRAADQLTIQQNHNSSATPLQDPATMSKNFKDDSSEDVDPQDAPKNALKRKPRESDDAYLATLSDVDNANFSASQYTSTPKRRTEDSNLLYPALQDATNHAKSRSQSIQQDQSHECGADADSESSYASSTHQHQDQRDNDNEQEREQPSNADASSLTNSDVRRVAASRSDFLDASEPRDTAPLYPTARSSSSLPSVAPLPAKIRVDRQPDLSGNASDSSGGASNSGSNSGGSSSHLASSFTSASKQSSAKSSNAGCDRDHADIKTDADAIGSVITDNVGDESLPFKRRSLISMPKPEGGRRSTSQRRSASRSNSASGSGSASDSGCYRRRVSNSQTPDDWDMSASAEHSPWHRNHRLPAGTSNEKLKLPQGEFVWRSDGAEAGISSISTAPGSLPWDAKTFAADPEAALCQSNSRSCRSSSGEDSSNEMDSGRPSGAAGYFGASTLSDLQDA